jgi:hypothetical protein
LQSEYDDKAVADGGEEDRTSDFVEEDEGLSSSRFSRSANVQGEGGNNDETDTDQDDDNSEHNNGNGNGNSSRAVVKKLWVPAKRVSFLTERNGMLPVYTPRRSFLPSFFSYVFFA